MQAAPRERILRAASAIIGERGADGLSIRAVGAAADVQAPAIYRIFGDRQGLLDAVTDRTFRGYVQAKTGQILDDAVDDLRRGWDLHIGFGLAHPELYAAVFGTLRGERGAVAVRAAQILEDKVSRIAREGRLAMSVEDAAQLVHATGRGVTLSLISLPSERRDIRLAVRAREMVMSTITDSPPPGASSPLVASIATLRALLPDVSSLSDAERAVMDEWLGRIER